MIRKIVLDEKSTILTEQQEKNEAYLAFVCEPGKIGSILKKIRKESLNSGWFEKDVALDVDNQFISARIHFKNAGGKIPIFDTPLLILSEYSDVFVPENYEKQNLKIVKKYKKFDDSSSLLRMADSSSEKPAMKGNRVKVGEIRSENCSFTFYRGSDGKIYKEVL